MKGCYENKKIILTFKNNIASITLNNPSKCNALDPIMRDSLIQAIIDCEKNADVQMIILNGNGKHFCTGADLDHMNKMKTVSKKENLTDAKKFAQLFYRVYSCQKPTIACVHGTIVGGGLGLLAACDIAIAAQHSTFRFSEVRVGLLPATIAPFVVQRMGYQASKYFMMTAELFDAQKAREIQLIDHVAKNPLRKSVEIAKSMLKNNQSALRATKKWLQMLHPVTKKQIDQAAIILANIRR